MEFCRKDGYCISVDVDATGKLIFTYYDLGIHNENTLYVSSANKYEESIIIDRNDKLKLYEVLTQTSLVYSDENLFEAITQHFYQVSGLEEIKKFLDQKDIIFKPYTWVEFYD
ncbi:MAG: hypothetical protein RBQ91_00480 [Acholeplasma sp.]|nr:hypothetical protein [Acholeplasma sp.]